MTDPTRRWLEVHARAAVTPDVGVLLADALVSAGARGVEERMGSYVAWFEEPEDAEDFVTGLSHDLAIQSGLPGLVLTHSWRDHADWAELWKQGLAPRRVTDRIVVHPSWAPPEDVRPGDIVLSIDPGMAFGTAEHGTTRGCLRLLDGRVEQGSRLLDIGSGSGILAMAAVGLGAAHVTAIEADALAVEALHENVEMAGASDSVEVLHARATADSIAAYPGVDGIVANLERGLLLPLIVGTAQALGPGRWLIVSGILEEEWEGVARTIEEHGFSLAEVDADDGWRSGCFARQAAGEARA
ncbi:MAG: 50S ribosomal protein L11 methyltransferase [Gemmatimonadota bacterium]